MSSVIEETLKALVEFEGDLDRAKAEAAESKRRMFKDGSDWAESAKATAVAKAQQIASGTLAKARAEAENEARSIRMKGEASLKSFESSISRKKGKAANQVVARLLGEEP